MHLSGSEKVAVLLLGIGKDAAAEIMRHMDRAELARILQAMSQLRRIDQETVDQVFLELHDLFQRPPVASGGPRSVQSLMTSAFGDKADAMSARLGLDKQPGLPALEQLSAETLAKYLATEHPQTIALVVAHLPAKKFRDTLKGLSPSIYTDILSRVARLESVDPDTLEQLNEALLKVAATAVHPSLKLGGVAKVAALLNTLDAEQGQRMLDQLAERDPDLVEQVRQQMFTFADLTRLDSANMALLLKHLDRKDLVLALKQATDDIVKSIYSGMSERAAQLLQDDVAAQGKVKRSDVEAAQSNVAATARQLLDSSTIRVIDDTEYVA